MTEHMPLAVQVSIAVVSDSLVILLRMQMQAVKHGLSVCIKEMLP